jgi:hypothetical protein
MAIPDQEVQSNISFGMTRSDWDIIPVNTWENTGMHPVKMKNRKCQKKWKIHRMKHNVF